MVVTQALSKANQQKLPALRGSLENQMDIEAGGIFSR